MTLNECEIYENRDLLQTLSHLFNTRNFEMSGRKSLVMEQKISDPPSEEIVRCIFFEFVCQSMGNMMALFLCWRKYQHE